MIIVSVWESSNLDESIKCISRWFTLTQRTRNLEFVNLKCVTYVQPIWVTLMSLSLRNGENNHQVLSGHQQRPEVVGDQSVSSSTHW